MVRTRMFKFLEGHIEYLAQRLQPAKCIAKEKKRDPAKYGSTADSRLENNELMIINVQASSQLDAYEKV